MRTNDWQKSWKNQLDKYDSPVDSSLFDTITTKATVKSGSSYLLGWIGLAIVVVSSALIIAGFSNLSNQNDGIADSKTEIFPSTFSENKSALELLHASSYIPANAFDISNSGKYVSSQTPLVKSDVVIIKKDKTTLTTVSSSKKSIRKNSALSIAEIQLPEISVDQAELMENISNSEKLNSKSVLNENNFIMEEAKVRCKATAPFSVLFPVKSKSKSFLPGMIDPESCFNDARGRSSFYIDAYIGAGNSIRSLSAVEDQAPYVHLRDSLEKSWYNSAAGARIGFILASGVAIETGAEYQVHNEIFEYKNESEVRITYKYHYDQFGTVTRIDTITEIGARTLRTHNKYQQITIPLRVGYTMEKGRWMLGARLGVGLHIWNHQNGVILDKTYQTYKIEEDPDGYFNKNWGMQYNASVQIGYRILPHTFLMIEPVWNSQSSGITQRPYTIEQKYQTLRLNVGIRFVPGSY